MEERSWYYLFGLWSLNFIVIAYYYKTHCPVLNKKYFKQRNSYQFLESLD